MNAAKVAAYGGAAVVGTVAAVVSFGHLRAVALAAGENATAATLLPVSVDGLLMASAGVMVLDWRAGRRSRPAARWAFAVGCAATLAGNVASATPTPLGWAVAGWAPLALLAVTEMLVRGGQRKRPETAVERRSAPDPTPRTPKRRTARGDAARRAAEAIRAHPGAPVAALARVAGVSRATVRRVASNGHGHTTTTAEVAPGG